MLLLPAHQDLARDIEAVREPPVGTRPSGGALPARLGGQRVARSSRAPSPCTATSDEGHQAEAARALQRLRGFLENAAARARLIAARSFRSSRTLSVSI